MRRWFSLRHWLSPEQRVEAHMALTEARWLAEDLLSFLVFPGLVIVLPLLAAWLL